MFIPDEDPDKTGVEKFTKNLSIFYQKKMAVRTLFWRAEKQFLV
jgi:hypothetical protein